MTISEKIRILARRKGLTMTALAEITGQTRQNLGNKLSRNNFTEEQAAQVADALGCDLSVSFIDRETGETL